MNEMIEGFKPVTLPKICMLLQPAVKDPPKQSSIHRAKPVLSQSMQVGPRPRCLPSPPTTAIKYLLTNSANGPNIRARLLTIPNPSQLSAKLNIIRKARALVVRPERN